jgi:hypothetical protein
MLRRLSDPALALAALGGIGLLVQGARRRVHPGSPAALGWVTIAGWLAIGLFSIWVQRKFFAYHYLPLLPSVALLAALPVLSALTALTARLGQPAMARALLPLSWGLLALPVFSARLGALADAVVDPAALRAYWDGPRRFQSKDMTVAGDLELADWLRMHSAPEDRVFLWSFEPMVYFLADRRLVSRFLYNYPLMIPWQPETYARELLDALERDPPRYFVVSSRDAMPKVNGNPHDSWQAYLGFAALRTFVETGYRRVDADHRARPDDADLGRFRIFEHTEARP